MGNPLWGEPDAYGIVKLSPELTKTIRDLIDPKLTEMGLEISIMGGADLSGVRSTAITYTLKWDGKPSLSIAGLISLQMIEDIANGDTTHPVTQAYVNRIQQLLVRANEKKDNSDND